MPFKPGQSGNPAGRPQKTEAERRVELLARAHTDKAISKLASLIDDEDGRIAGMACTALLDRGWGKPTQTLNADIVKHIVDDSRVSGIRTRLRQEPEKRSIQ